MSFANFSPDSRHRLSPLAAAIVTAFTFLFSLINSHAVVMTPLSIEELSQKAAMVLHGTVSTKTAQLDDAGRIFTRIELDVLDTWKGPAPASGFTIVQSGGVVGQRRSVVPGQPELNIGEEVVVFLSVNSRGEGVILGIAQGKFEVKTEATGEKVVTSVFHGKPGTGAGNRALHSGTSDDSKLTLTNLKQRVTEVTK